MCGIALFLAGVRIIRAAAASDDGAIAASVDGANAGAGAGCPILQMDDIKASLLKRGPDNLCSRKLFLHVNWTNSVEMDSIFCIQHGNDEEGKENDESLCFGENEKECIITSQDVSSIRKKAAAELDLVGATLQLRGRTPISQPLVDVSGNVLVYNGEIFGGIHVAQDSNDAETLLYALERCCSCAYLQLGTACSCIHHGEKSVPHILSSIRGPWALIYWQERSKTIWFGRDAYGRRSLLVHWPTINDPRLILSSVSPSTFGRKSDSEMEERPDYWEELPCGIYSINLRASKPNEQFGKNELVGEERKYEWTDHLLNKLIRWERKAVDPKMEETLMGALPSQNGQRNQIVIEKEFREDTTGSMSDLIKMGQAVEYTHPAQKVLITLTQSVMRRTSLSRTFQTTLHQSKEMEPAPVALLFSGGLDSMILAAISDQCLDPNYTIDLLNVSFDGHLAPDRISARVGIRELQRVAPQRSCNCCILIDALVFCTIHYQ